MSNTEFITHLDNLFNRYDDSIMIEKSVKIEYATYNKLLQIAEDNHTDINALLIHIYMLYNNEYLLNRVEC